MEELEGRKPPGWRAVGLRGLALRRVGGEVKTRVVCRAGAPGGGSRLSSISSPARACVWRSPPANTQIGGFEIFIEIAMSYSPAKRR